LRADFQKKPIEDMKYKQYASPTSPIPSLARKRTGDAEIGWRPTPEKNIETMPCWGKKIARRNASWTWDVKHERALSPADLFGGKTPVGA